MNHGGVAEPTPDPVTPPVEEPKPADWLDGNAPEPEWPKDHKPPLPEAPKLHHCDGCDKDQPVESFDAVDARVAGQYVVLVRCAECRTKRPVSGTPYDDRATT